MVDKVAARRAVDTYRRDSVKQAGQDLADTKQGIDRDPRLRNIRTDGDDSGGSSQSEKLDMILSHLDSIHTALADANARMDAFEGKGRADGDEDDQPNDQINYGDPSARGSKVGDDDRGEPQPLIADRQRRDARKDEDMNENMPIERHDSARRAASEFQARADKVFQAFGDSAPRYLSGESLIAYKQRLLSKMKKHSQTWAKTDIYRLRDPEAIAIAADQIFQDADAYARSPASVPQGYLREVRERDQSGREIVRFVGNAEDVWGPWKATTRRLVHVNKNPNA